MALDADERKRLLRKMNHAIELEGSLFINVQANGTVELVLVPLIRHDQAYAIGMFTLKDLEAHGLFPKNRW